MPLLAAAAALAGAALYLLREREIAVVWGYSLDDAWIHAVIARNFASGHGWSFNPGEITSASTGPLFTFLLSAFYTVTGPSVWVSKGIGIACHALASGVTCLAVLSAVRGATAAEPRGAGAAPAWASQGIALAAGLLVATSPSLVWAAVSGMEVSLYVLLLVLGLWLHFEGRGTASTAIWALGVWVRPDGALLAILGAALGRGKSLHRAAVLAAILVPYVAFHHAIGHAPLPATVYTKAHVDHEALARLGQLGKFFSTQRGLWGIPGNPDDFLPHSPLLLAGVVAGSLTGGRACLLLGAYVALFSIAFGLASPNPGSQCRYVLPLIPVAIVLSAVAVVTVTPRLTRGHRAVVAAVVCILLAAPQWISLPRAASDHGWNVQNINGMHRFLGEHFAKTTAPSDRVATNDIGAIRFFSGRYVVDVAGLASPRSPLPDLLTAYRPSLLAVFPSWYSHFAHLDSASANVYFDDADGVNRYWGRYYVELKRNTVAARSRMFIYERMPREAPPPKERWSYLH